MDITIPLGAGTPCYPGDTPFSRDARSVSGFTSSRLTLSSHSGTHMDAPSHLAGVEGAIDSLSAGGLILPCRVLDCRGMRSMGPQLFEHLDLSGYALLFRTGAAPGLKPDMPGMTTNAARGAEAAGVRLVGTDTISIDPPRSMECHRILLPASIPILENLDLRGVSEGEYTLLCFPLRIEDGDGSPVRAFLGGLDMCGAGKAQD